MPRWLVMQSKEKRQRTIPSLLTNCISHTLCTCLVVVNECYWIGVDLWNICNKPLLPVLWGRCKSSPWIQIVLGQAVYVATLEAEQEVLVRDS